MWCKVPKNEAKIYVVVCIIFAIIETALLVAYIFTEPEWAPNFSVAQVAVAIVLSLISIVGCLLLYHAIQKVGRC